MLIRRRQKPFWAGRHEVAPWRPLSKPRSKVSQVQWRPKGTKIQLSDRPASTPWLRTDGIFRDGLFRLPSPQDFFPCYRTIPLGEHGGMITGHFLSFYLSLQSWYSGIRFLLCLAKFSRRRGPTYVNTVELDRLVSRLGAPSVCRPSSGALQITLIARNLRLTSVQEEQGKALELSG